MKVFETEHFVFDMRGDVLATEVVGLHPVTKTQAPLLHDSKKDSWGRGAKV
jgi:hypothetical protein